MLKSKHLIIVFVAGLLLSLVVFPGAVHAQAVDIRINFQDAATTPPATYWRDSGEGYGVRNGANQSGGAYNYGWVTPGTTNALNLSNNGRNRAGTAAEIRLATFMHMQADDIAGSFSGSKTEGWWEIGLPNGLYQVTVSAGDANQTDSIHHINVEGALAVNDFLPTGSGGASSMFQQGSVTVQLNDGRLTINATGGNNTKINYVTIVSSAGPAIPTVVSTSPTNFASGVSVSGSITVTGMYLPNGGVDNATVHSDTVYLYRTLGDPVTDRVVLSSLNTTGGGDAITLTPAGNLAPNTNYTLIVTNQVKDVAGVAMTPYSMSFTTGTGGGAVPTIISFTRTNLGVVARGYTSVTVGPDGRLYAATNTGQIYHWNIAANGTLSNEVQINKFSGRIIVGLAFQPGAPVDDPILWVSHNQGVLTGATNFTGGISALTVDNLGQGGETWTRTDFVTGLPRARKDHLSNSLVFGPDGAMYMTQGSISATGARDSQWGNQPESVLSASLLRIDLNLLYNYWVSNGQIALNVATGTLDGGTNNLPDPNTTNNPGLGDPRLNSVYYNPQAAGAPVTLYATGIRNAYDLVWHTNGRLYTATNGSAANGNVPGTPSPAWPVSCANRIDNAANGAYTGPTLAAAFMLVNQADYVFRIVPGGYYGHPNPTRCEWVKDGGNPTAALDAGQVGNHYPVGTLPDRNYRGISYNLGYNKSPNGTIEYRNAAAFGGLLQGRILIVRYSADDDIIVLTPGGANGDIVSQQTEIAGFSGFNNPLDLTENVATGDLYVAEYAEEDTSSDNKLWLLRPNPVVPGTPNVVSSTSRLVFNDISGGGSSTEQLITITNTGTGTAGITTNAPVLSGTNANQFEISTISTTTVLNPGQSTVLGIKFNPTGNGPKFASLSFQTTDAAHPTITIALAGLGTAGLFGSNEPSLQWILDTWSITTQVGDDNPTTSPIHSTNSSFPLLGQEVSVQSFRAVSGGTVNVYPLASFGPDSSAFSETTIFGWYGMANPASETPLFTINKNTSQTLNPTYNGTPSFSFNPGGAAFGFYSTWPAFANRDVYSEDSLNLFADAIRHKVRVYPFITASGVVSNAYVIAFEETPSGQDYNDFVFLVTNVEPAPVTPGGALVLDNRDWTTLNGLAQPISQLSYLNGVLNFSTIDQGVTSHRSHDTVTLRVKNSDPVNVLRVTGVTLSDPTEFSLIRNEAGFNIAPNSFYDVEVRFIEDSGSSGLRNQTLTLTTSDPVQPSVVVYLNGNYELQPDDANEPTLTQLLSAFGSTSNITQPLSSQYVAYGDEVLSFRWRRAVNTQPVNTQPVYVRQIAAYHNCCADPITFQITGAGGGSFTHDAVDAQSILPLKSGTSSPAEMTVNPTTDFVIDVNGFTSDECESGLDANGMCNAHGLRLWKLRDYANNIIPNAYLVIQENLINGCGPAGNCDFNDNVYIVTNIAPASTAPITPVLQLPANGATATNGYGDPTFEWSNVPDATYYYFYLATSTGQQIAFEVLSREGYCSGATCSFVPPTLRENYRLVNGGYVWSVSAWGPFGVSTAAPLSAFTLNANAPDLVTLEASSDINTLRPTFKWNLNTVGQRRATAFNIYVAPRDNLGASALFRTVSRTDACSSPTGTTCQFVSPVDLVDETDYSLYIQSYGPGGALTTTGPFDNGYAGPAAGVSSFRLDAPTPNLPSAIALNFGQGLPTISWADDNDAASFNIYLSNYSSNAALNWTTSYHFQNYPRTTGAGGLCNSGTCSIKPLLVLANGAYNVAVQGVGQGGASGGGTYGNGYGVLENQTLNKAVPPAPSAGFAPAFDSTIATGKPTFTWNTVAGAISYQLWVGTVTPTFTTRHMQWYWAAAPDCNPHPGTCSIMPDLNLPAGAYAWNVQAYGPGGLGNWVNLTTGIPFTISAPLPGIVTLNTPAINATLTNPSPTITWNDIAGVDWYQVWIGTPAFVPSHLQWYRAERGAGKLCNGGTCSLNVPGLVLPNGAYYWNVQAATPAGIGPYNPEGTWGRFTIAVPVPGVVALTAPIHDGLISTTNRPTLVWNTVSNGLYYQLEVKNGMGTVIFTQWYTRGVAPCTDSSCSVQLPNVLAYGTYSWRVQAASQGGIGAFTNARRFLMLSYNLVPMMMPAQDEMVVRGGAWMDVQGDAAALGDDYLASSSTGSDSLTLTFEGTSADIVYVAGPSYGTFIIEIDGVALLGVNANATQVAYGQIASVTDLAAGTHTLRIVPLAGMPVAIDTIVVGGQAVTTVIQPTPVTPAPVVITPVEPTPTLPAPEVTPLPTEAPATEPAPTEVPTETAPEATEQP